VTQVSIGRLARAHGLHGELLLVDCPLDASELERVQSIVWRGRDGAILPLRLASQRPIHRGRLVSFTGYGDRDRAAALSGGELLTDESSLPDPGPDVAYTFQLIGMEVRNDDGRRLGVLEQIWNTGAHPIYVVQGERELLVPAHPGVLVGVDREARIITVSLPPGLEEL
jgi:16S rRNA processing protein RimM